MTLAELEALANDVEEIEQLLRWAAEHSITINIRFKGVGAYLATPMRNELIDDVNLEDAQDSRLAALLDLLRTIKGDAKEAGL